MKTGDTWMDAQHLHRQGLKISAIARQLGIDRKTVRTLLKDKDPPCYKTRPPKPSLLDPYKTYIEGRLRQYDLTAVRLLEEIRAQGYPGRYSILKRHVARVKAKHRVLAVARFETKPGGQGQVDWAEFGRIRIDGEERKLYLFGMVLGYSRMRYIEFTLDTKTETFIRCHQNAFRYFGGYPDELLYDNLKSVALANHGRHDRHEWNPLFQDFAKHYGIVPRLCRPYRPQTKGKVENNVKFVRNNFFEGRSFASLQDLNAQVLAWCRMVNAKVHGTTHEVPVERLPKEGLAPFADKPLYLVTIEAARKISRECFVSYQGNRYSVPWRFAAREAIVKVRAGKLHVVVAGQEVASHDIPTGGNQVVRVPDHFSGLIVAIRQRPRQATRHFEFTGDVEVQRRELNEYERCLESFVAVSQ